MRLPPPIEGCEWHPAEGPVEERSQLRDGLDLLEVDLPGGEGREVRRRSSRLRASGSPKPSRLMGELICDFAFRSDPRTRRGGHGRERAHYQSHCSKNALSLHIPTPLPGDAISFGEIADTLMRAGLRSGGAYTSPNCT
jgi:hypothetical protein